jgi:preprotein translocase subunit SecF
MTKRAEKRMRLREEQEEADKGKSSEPVAIKETVSATPPSSHMNYSGIQKTIFTWYSKNLKRLEIIPIILLILAILQISFQMYTHNGDFINKDISLKGGLTITISQNQSIDTDALDKFLSEKGYSAYARNIESGGKTVAVLIEADVDFSDKVRTENFINALKERFPLTKDSYSVQGLGSNIGQSFFRQTILTLIISFVLMSVVVAVSFRALVPCGAVILAAFSDIIMTIATVNLLGVKVSTAGIAAFIMLIGYSVDTDILLTTRVLRRHEGTIMDRIFSSAKTGFLTTATTMAVSFIGMLVSSSDVIRQIMLIIFIGMIYDQVNTWIQNAGILKTYAEKKEKQKVQY